MITSPFAKGIPLLRIAYCAVVVIGVASRRVFVGSGAGGPGGEEDALEGLGELAQLTVTNEADSAYDVSTWQGLQRGTED